MIQATPQEILDSALETQTPALKLTDAPWQNILEYDI